MQSRLTVLVLLFAACFPACSAGADRGNADAPVVLVASTPGDAAIKSQLGIPVEKTVDFIRWNLTLQAPATFTLDLLFGVSQPNTLGFQGGGEKKTFTGKYTRTSEMKGEVAREVYHLQGDGIRLAFVQLNDHLFHLLTPDNQLMVGNGGWSYSLNRKDPAAPTVADFPFPGDAAALAHDTAVQQIFDGRTPCAELAGDYPYLQASDACFKLKWRIILNRDPKTLAPTTYRLRNIVDNEPKEVEGTWKLIREGKNVLYQLNPDQPEKSFFLLAGDENVLFFVDKNRQFYPGNGDFSYTLNRRR